jgi:hypothetical protein
MKTSRLLTIITTVAVLACAAPNANARPASDPAGARTAAPQASTPASIALHHEQISQEQYLASHGTGAPVEPLTDGTDTDNQFPLVFVLVGISIPLGIGLAMIVSRPIRAYARHRRSPASAA